MTFKRSIRSLPGWLRLGVLAALPFCALDPNCLTAGEAVAPVQPILGPDGKPLAAEAKRAPVKINDEDLQRVDINPAQRFPWADKPQPVKPVIVKPAPDKAATPGSPGTPAAPASGSDSAMDMGGDMIVRSYGPFTRELKKSNAALAEPDKEWMTVTVHVEIEMVETQTVLRGENVVIVRDIKSGETELIEAKGNIELDSPDSAAKGDMMRLEMQKNEAGEFTKNQFTLIGDPAAGKKATLWMYTDPKDRSIKNTIQATRFFRDLRLETFRATGSPNAIIITPEDPADAAAAAAAAAAKPPPKSLAPGEKPAPKPSSGMGDISLSGAGKVNMRADAELYFDGPTGKLTLARNVVFIKEGAEPGDGVMILSDNATVTMDVPPPGQAPAGGNNAFSGEMKMLECFGRVEIKSGTQTILCDKMKMDKASNILYTEMNSTSDTVQVYNQSLAIGGELILAPKTLKINLTTKELEPGGPLKMKSFAGPPASNRGNGPKPEDIKPLPDPKAKPAPVDPKAKPGTDPKKPVK